MLQFRHLLSKLLESSVAVSASAFKLFESSVAVPASAFKLFESSVAVPAHTVQTLKK